MKKIIMMLLGVAFATCAMAADVTDWVFDMGKTTLMDGYTGKAAFECSPMANTTVYCFVANGATGIDRTITQNDLLSNLRDYGVITIEGMSALAATGTTDDSGKITSVNRVCFKLNDSAGVSFGDKLDFYAVAFSPEGDFVYISGLESATAEDSTTTLKLSSAPSTTLVDKEGTQDFSCAGWYSLASSSQDLDPIEYLTWDEGTKSLVAATNTTYEVVTEDTEKFEDGKWYIVTNTIERAGITVNGEAHLILCDGASLKVTGSTAHTGIVVPEGGALTIYGQSEGTGELTATGAGGRPGIGGHRGFSTIPCGSITINGGKVTAIGGENAAGIGGVPGLDGGAVTINGGIVVAAAGEGAAAIGAGIDGTSHGTIAFAEGVNFSIKAGASEAAATATTVADYVADRSAAYVKIEVGSSGPTQDPIESTVKPLVDAGLIKFEGAETSYVDGDLVLRYTATSGANTLTLPSYAQAWILEVGGGGAGGSGACVSSSYSSYKSRGTGGGGGGGGFVETNGVLLAGGDYTITVGAGGARATQNATPQVGDNGKPSYIRWNGNPIPDLEDALGGGGGGAESVGRDGGSGGGGSMESVDSTATVRLGGTGSQGANGGTGAKQYYGAGGGGAGGAGCDGTSSGMATGGVGRVSRILDNTEIYYAGGGGGGIRNTTSVVNPGGLGGGGAGASGMITEAEINGKDGFGGGGGGNSIAWAGGAGGSGVVIIRIKKIIPLAIEAPAEGEFFGFVDPDGFALPIRLGASDDDLKNPAGFAVKVTSCGSTLYEKEDVLFQKDNPTEIEINEGYSYDETNVMRTATITVKTPDGRVTTRTLTFGVIPKGGVIVHDLDEINAAIGKAEEEKKYPLVLVKANVIALETGDSIALPTPDTNVNVYFSSVNRDEELFDISAIVPTFGSPYDVVTNFADSNLVYLDPELEWSTSAKDWVVVGYTTNVLTTVEQQLAHFINTNDVAKLVYDAERQTISLIGRGESEDFPWILDASTNVTAWVENSSLVINNGLNSEAYDIDLVAMTNNFAKYGYTAPANALVKVVNGSTTNTVTSAGWVGENGAYATLEDAIAAGEAKVLPGYAVSYEANGAAGSMTNSVFAVGKDSTLKANEFSAIGYDFAGWATNGVEAVAYADAATVKDLAPVDGSATLTAQWSLNTNGVTATSFTSLTNMLATAKNQGTNLGVTIGFDSGVTIPAGETVTLPSGSCGFEGLKYVGDDEGGSDLYLEDGVLYGSAMRGEVTVDALQLMTIAKGGSITEFKALSEGEGGTTVTNDVVMLLGNDGVPYETIEDVLAADPRPTFVTLYEVLGPTVTVSPLDAENKPADLDVAYSFMTNLCLDAFLGWDANFVVTFDKDVKANSVSLKGAYAAWNNGEWIEMPMPENILTNGVLSANTAWTLLPEGQVTFGDVVTIGEFLCGVRNFGVANLDTKMTVDLVLSSGETTLTISKTIYTFDHVCGESEENPWVLDEATNVVAWVESSNLVINNGLTAESYEIDLDSLTNNAAIYGYPTSPLNAKVKVAEADYKTPKCWIGESDSYETLGDALEAGETTVLPGYEVVYEANGAAGSMTNSYFAAAKDSTLKANEFSAVGYDFEGWTLGTNTTVIADSDTVKDLASVDGSATLTAQWSLNADGVTEVSFDALTNTIATAGLQKTNLPITIDFTSEVVIPTNAVLSAFPSGTGFSGIRYVPEEEGYSTLAVSNDVLYASTVREEVTVDALVLMRHAMGGSIAAGKLQAYTTDEAGETIATNIVMFVGDNHKAYFNDEDNIDQMIEAVLAAVPRPTKVKLYEVKGAMVTFEAMGGLVEAGTDPLGNAYEGDVERITYLCLPDPGYELPEVSREDYKLIGWFDGWTNGVHEVTNKQEIVNYDEHPLYAKWQSTKIHPSETPGEKIIETKEGEDGTIIRPTDTSALPAELILPETDTGAAEGTPLTKIDEKAFMLLPNVTKVALPLYVKEVGARAFYNETNLGEVTFVQPRDYDTLDKVPLTIGERAFSGTKIEKVRIPSTTTVIGSAAFANCPNLKEVELLGAPTIEGVYPFRNSGTAVGGLKITLSPRAAADQGFINSLTNGCLNVEINEKYAGEIEIGDFRVKAETIEIDFTYSANDVDINVDTVTAVYAASLDKVTATKDPMTTLEVRANGSNSYTAVCTKPEEGSSGFFRLTVNIEK